MNCYYSHFSFESQNNIHEAKSKAKVKQNEAKSKTKENSLDAAILYESPYNQFSTI